MDQCLEFLCQQYKVIPLKAHRITLKAKTKSKHENDTQATSEICLMQYKNTLIQGLKTEIGGQTAKAQISREALWLPVLSLLDPQAALGCFLSGEKGNFKSPLPVP